MVSERAKWAAQLHIVSSSWCFTVHVHVSQSRKDDDVFIVLLLVFHPKPSMDSYTLYMCDESELDNVFSDIVMSLKTHFISKLYYLRKTLVYYCKLLILHQSVYMHIAHMFSILNEIWNQPIYPFLKTRNAWFKSMFQIGLAELFPMDHCLFNYADRCLLQILGFARYWPILRQFVQKPVQNLVIANGKCKSYNKNKYHKTALLRAL